MSAAVGGGGAAEVAAAAWVSPSFPSDPRAPTHRTRLPGCREPSPRLPSQSDFLTASSFSVTDFLQLPAFGTGTTVHRSQSTGRVPSTGQLHAFSAKEARQMFIQAQPFRITPRILHTNCPLWAPPLPHSPPPQHTPLRLRCAEGGRAASRPAGRFVKSSPRSCRARSLVLHSCGTSPHRLSCAPT